MLISPFYQADEPVLPVPEGIPAWVIYAAAGGGVLFLVLLLVILLLAGAAGSGAKNWRRRDWPP